ncbi:hypothetical protein [Leifsonia xyli]|uniref:hypothetical protein n=1 Tax=Leifsonia xyli TaxID=1575 RepID=UPI0012FDC608
MLWIAGGCGAVFLALLLVQLANPEAQLFPVALPFGIAGAALSFFYTIRKQ